MQLEDSDDWVESDRARRRKSDVQEKASLSLQSLPFFLSKLTNACSLLSAIQLS